MRYIIMSLILLAAGCIDWETSALNYKCSDTQMNKVEKETLWCTEHSGYNKSFCYSSAIARNCDKKDNK